MASSRKRVRLSFDLHFTCEEQKQAFCNRISVVKTLLTPPGSRVIDNMSMLNALFDMVSSHDSLSPSPSPLTNPPPLTQSFLPNSGKV